MSETEGRQVEAMAAYGIPEKEIARVIGIDAVELRNRYPDELDTGATKANSRVAENLYRKATGEGREAVTAAIFWLKTRPDGEKPQRMWWMPRSATSPACLNPMTRSKTGSITTGR